MLVKMYLFSEIDHTKLIGCNIASDPCPESFNFQFCVGIITCTGKIAKFVLYKKTLKLVMYIVSNFSTEIDI